ncbi:MAG: glucokinase [Gammaproteobacteria bacterium]|nr:glucokinase [Gammaproteobacteria bacterium]NIR81878.1 glucokinase [Gammaproteobacteria bacterium]NIR88710.1 glucokinase [Gammaproteobacteria bacterium]NIU02986.1 glucokinase [Gammaproteobacteria bacterium]NIV50507.1 glucokinase [Gammaproteobacteria bacterium]
MRVIAGDLGGTKTTLRVAEVGARAHPGHRVVCERTYASRSFKGFAALLADFLAGVGATTGSAAQSACFGVPGPVQGTRARTTNLPWSIDAREIAREFSIRHVCLINDFQALGYGVEMLDPADLVTLQPGRARPGAPRALLGAGTGLGTALLVPCGERYEVLPSEGGHVDFAPTDEVQMALLRELLARFGVVSYERVLSGPGLVLIDGFLRRRAGASGLRESPPEAAAAAISQAAIRGEDPIAAEALDVFVHIYGAQAGNLALTTLATGGVYIAGGIAPKIIDKLTDGQFVQAFRNKGPMRSLLECVPVHVIVNVTAPLLGAAAVAARALESP